MDYSRRHTDCSLFSISTDINRLRRLPLAGGVEVVQGLGGALLHRLLTLADPLPGVEQALVGRAVGVLLGADRQLEALHVGDHVIPDGVAVGELHVSVEVDLDDTVADSRQELLLGGTGTTVEDEEYRVGLLGIRIRVGLLGVHVLRVVRDDRTLDFSAGVLELGANVLLVLAQQPGPELDGTRLVNTVNVTESCIWM